MKFIGIRREDKNEWEHRVPLIPEDVKELKQKYSILTQIQPSNIRSFQDKEYIEAGAIVKEKLSQSPIIFAVKEIPLWFFEPHKTYVFFSHTIKGQAHNMPILRRMIELKCQLIDYERIVDKNGRRLISFGRYAGIAGMVDTLWALGKRLNYEGIKNPFSNIKETYKYKDLNNLKKEILKLGKEFRLPKPITPLVCGFLGYGNVSKGAQEVLDLLPTIEIKPNKIEEVWKRSETETLTHIYKVVFKEEDMVELRDKKDEAKFNLIDYYNYPHKYQSKFDSYLPYLTILMNCIYWAPQYPKFVTKEGLKKLYTKTHMLRVIGDISCDIEGAVECTLYATNPGAPVFVYNPFTQTTTPGVEGTGPVVLSVDNLPCELPKDSSIHFSSILKDFVPDIVNADFKVKFEDCNLRQEIKDAIVVYQGLLTPKYKYLEKYL